MIFSLLSPIIKNPHLPQRPLIPGEDGAFIPSIAPFPSFSSNTNSPLYQNACILTNKKNNPPSCWWPRGYHARRLLDKEQECLPEGSEEVEEQVLF